MTDSCCKRVTVRFRSPEIISRIEELPSGFISMVIEAAMAAYLESETGNNLVNLLIRRNQNHRKFSKKHQESIQQRFSSEQGEPKDTPIKRTRGDF